MTELLDLERRDALRRLWASDASIFAVPENRRAAVKNRLGWLHVPTFMARRAGEVAQFADEVRKAGFRHVLLVGMGGSSLAPELFARTFPHVEGWPELRVLDSTSPRAVRGHEDAIDLSRTLFVVSTKSGSTIETLSFYRYFRGRVARGDAFVAITDEGSPLQDIATRDGFRRTFLNPADIGGRYSALSYFGLVPAALMGVDITKLLLRAEREVAVSDAGRPLADVPGAVLGAELAGHARQGRDKLTLYCAPAVAALGAWVEQLVAESTGKDGKGIVPVDGERLAAPAAYGDDRVFVSLELEPDPERIAALATLRSAGHPVMRYRLRDIYDVGALFFRFELATALAGILLELNPFDEPNVGEAKETTGQILARFKGRALDLPETSDPAALLDLLGDARPGDYVALLPYIAPTPEREAVLQDIQAALRDRTRCPATVGFGPRFLHSTGQLHKGGPNTGLFAQLVGRDLPPDGQDLAIPGDDLTFGRLRDAQAAGDLEVLRRRGRRAVRIDLGDDPDAGLARLAALVRAAG